MKYEPFLVDVTLQTSKGDDEIISLKPTFKASKMISRLKGGHMSAVEAIMRLEHDTIVMVLNIALGNSGTPTDDLNERVYSTGLSKLAAPLVKFIRSAVAGGRDPDAEADEPDKDAPKGE